jgi:hypothetical protein
MEGPTVTGRLPGRLLRVCQRSRLEKQIMSDAYERLVPIIRCRCDKPDSSADSWPNASALAATSKACCAGGGL